MRETPVGTRLERLLDLAAGRLEAAGVPRPRREAVQLLAALLDVPSGEVWLGRTGAGEGPEADRFLAVVDRRAAGMPFAYAAGRTGFRRITVRTDARALIPRPETEGLVELVLRQASGTGGVAADVGTGTGCIACALAVEGDFARIIATDVAPLAAMLARENVARVAPPIPVDVREGDLLAPLAGARCRVIVSNPPYLTEDEWAGLEPAVRDFEPQRALVGGADGLAVIRRLFAEAGNHLAPGGLLALEIDERRATAVRDIGAAHRWRVTIHEDLFGRARYALARERT